LDGSLWLVPDPAGDAVEPLTPSLPAVRDLRWSPDGEQLAFVGGADVYVVSIAEAE
jgi:Tol biopolymer transport system component